MMKRKVVLVGVKGYCDLAMGFGKTQFRDGIRSER
jgi:hypothetical protein